MCSCWNWHWKQTTTRLNWRVFPILITLCKYVLCWISMNFWGARINWPIDCGPYNGGSPGEGRGFHFQNRRFRTRGWAMWRHKHWIWPETVWQNESEWIRMNKSKVQVSNWNCHFNFLQLKSSAFGHQKRPAFLQENFLWYVNSFNIV